MMLFRRAESLLEINNLDIQEEWSKSIQIIISNLTKRSFYTVQGKMRSKGRKRKDRNDEDLLQIYVCIIWEAFWRYDHSC